MGRESDRAFTWDGTMRDLGISNGYVVGLTDSGAVAGHPPDPATTATRPFTLSGTVLRELAGFDGGVSAVALGINGRGTVVGYATPANGPSRAVAWTGPQPTVRSGSLEIGWLGWSTAYGINASGVIVGESSAHGGSTAVVFRGNGVIEELGRSAASSGVRSPSTTPGSSSAPPSSTRPACPMGSSTRRGR